MIAPISRSNEWSLNTIYAYISHTNTKKDAKNDILFCDPFGARTQDPNIKSVVLYQLS